MEPEWLVSRPAPRPAGPGAEDAAERTREGNGPPRPRSAGRQAARSANARTGPGARAGGAPHFRTHALDHIRRRDGVGVLAETKQHPNPHPHPPQLLPLQSVHGPADSALLSPVPTALPTDRSISASAASLRLLSASHRHSPRALSPVSANTKDRDAHAGILRARRPATAEPARREHRRAGGRTGGVPRAVGRENSSLIAAADASPPRRRLPPAMDLDESFVSVGTVVSAALNNTLPLSPRDPHDGAESVQDAIQMLERGHAPRVMNLRGSLDGAEMHEVERLFEHLAVARTIQALNLSCNHFSDPMCWSLERLLEKNRSCMALRLGNNRMTDKMCASVVSAVHKNAMSHVTEMYLGNNQAGMLTADALARALKPSSGGLKVLRVLNISHNRLGDAGGALVIEAIQDNVSLRTLDLGSNDLASKTKHALCKTLKVNRTLEEIRIERNPGLEEQGGLIDILTTLRFSMHSALKMLYTVEPLGMFCMDADLSGRDTKHWDNRTVIRFLRDVRLWYGDLSTVLFPISSQMWTATHRCIKRVERALLTGIILGWHRVSFVHAASRVRRKRHDKQVLQRPHFNLWANILTQRDEAPRFLERMRILHSKTVLLYLTTWRLCWRHKRFFTRGLTHDTYICQHCFCNFARRLLAPSLMWRVGLKGVQLSAHLGCDAQVPTGRGGLRCLKIRSRYVNERWEKFCLLAGTTPGANSTSRGMRSASNIATKIEERRRSSSFLGPRKPRKHAVVYNSYARSVKKH